MVGRVCAVLAQLRPDASDIRRTLAASAAARAAASAAPSNGAGGDSLVDVDMRRASRAFATKRLQLMLRQQLFGLLDYVLVKPD